MFKGHNMTSYICTKCKIEKDEIEFHKRKDRPKGRASLCKQCSCKRWRDFRDENPELIKQNFQNWVSRPGNKEHLKELWKQRDKTRERKLREILLLFKDAPCTDCKIKYPSYVMDFDHLDASQKLFCVGQLNKAWSAERLLAEIEKCELVCANCHRIRTHNRKNNERS